MSVFTGKCDFFDTCCMIRNPQEIVEKSNIYLGDARVMIRNEKDLIPYYTHLVASACYSEGFSTIHLSKNSFIDSEEREFLAWKIRDAIKAFRKAKREKVEVTLDYIKKQDFFFGSTDDSIWLAITDKIKKNDELVKMHISKDYRKSSYFITNWIVPNYFHDIHDSMHNRHREEFIKFAQENGYATFKVENGEFKSTDGENHPIIWDMCKSVEEFYKMNEKYGGRK